MPRRHLLPEALQGGPFTATSAFEAGLSRSALKGGRLRRVAPRVYSATSSPELAERVRAQLLTMPSDLIAEGVTALQLYGIEVGPATPLRFCSPDGHDIRRLGVKVRRVKAAPQHRRQLVTPIAALTTAAAELDLVELVVAGDWLIRSRRATLAHLQQALAAARGPYAVKLRRAGELIRENVDSPQESRLRMMLVLAGLPHPECNVDIGNEFFFIAKVDLAYLPWKLLLEYEGDQHRVSKSQWNRDIDRFEWLGEEGYVVIRVSAARLKRPRALVEAVHAALVRAGYDGPPPSYSPEWLAHFESGNSGRRTTI